MFLRIENGYGYELELKNLTGGEKCIEVSFVIVVVSAKKKANLSYSFIRE